MEPFEVAHRLRKAGHTQVDLAKEFDCTQGFINHVIYGRKSNLRIQTRIAEILGEPVESIWPFATETTLPQISGGAQ